MTSHLTISYGASTPAASPPVASGTAAPAGDGGLGFLAALIDQIVAGTATATADTPTASTALTAPTPFGIAIDPTAIATAKTTPQGVALLTALTKTLKAVKDQLDAGQSVDPDLLKKLGDTADALAALIAAPPPLAAPTATAAPAADPLATIGPTGAAPTPSPAPALPDPSLPALTFAPTAPSADPSASTGDTAAPAAAPDTNAVPTVSSPPATPPLPGIAELTAKLADVSQTIAPTAPAVAAQLQALTQQLAAVQATPQVLAQLAGTADDVQPLDTLVRRILDAKPTLTVPVTPALATPPALPVPAAIATPTLQPQTADAQPAQPARKSALPAAPASKPDTKDPAPQTAFVGPKPETVDPTAPKPDSPQTTTDSSVQASAAASATTPAIATPRAIPAAYQAATNPINMGQVAFEMVRQLQQGSSRFSIRLDPPELGRVDVKMHVDATGNVNARLTVERSETLDMFQRDRGSLEKALSQAGLDSGKTSLEFSLRQNPFAGMTGGDQRQPGAANTGARFSLSSSDDEATPTPSVTLYRGIASAGGVNIYI